MRIRPKTLLSLCLMALMAILAASCCKHKVTERDTILLGTSSIGTRALVTGKLSLIDLSYSNNTGFGVYGYKQVGSSNYPLFDNFVVKPTENDVETTWYYTPIRFWDKNPNAFYQFIAYWPKLPDEGDNPGQNDTYVSESGKVLTIHHIPNWQPTETGTDYLLADPRVGQHVSNTDTPLFGSGKVNFLFSHLLSKVEFRAYYVGAQSEVAVNQITLKSPVENNNNVKFVLPSNGAVDVTRNFGESGHPTQIGTPANGTSTNLMSQSVTLPEETWFNPSIDSVPTHFQTLCSWLTVPCSLWDSLDLAVNYSIASSPITGSASGFTLTTQIKDDNDNVTATYKGQTLPGHSYLVTLKFTASSGIEIESIQIKNWITGEVSSPSVYNW